MPLQRKRGEGPPQLARRLFFAHQGAFQTGDDEEIMHKATCLSLLLNAVRGWHTVPMTRIIQPLRAHGETMRDEELSRISPVAFAPGIPHGTYCPQRKPLTPEEAPTEARAPLDRAMVGDSARL